MFSTGLCVSAFTVKAMFYLLGKLLREPALGACVTLLQDLTKSTVHPMGGQAYLSLENSEDPFQHGIKFTAMPPSKRFREMEQLSGGEKVTCLIRAFLACC